MQNLYYNFESSSLTLLPEGYIPGSTTVAPVEYVNIANLIVCSSLLEIHAIDSFNNLLAAFPIEDTNIFYGGVPSELVPSQPQQQEEPVDISSTLVNYSYTTNNTASSFTINQYNTVGVQQANTSITLTGSLGYNTVVLISYIDPQLDGFRTYTYTTELSSSTISGSTTTEDPPYNYWLPTGSSASDSATKLTANINRTLSGSFASSSLDLLIASSSGNTVYITSSLPGELYNDFYIEIGSITILGDSVTYNSGPRYFLSGGLNTLSLSGSTNIIYTTQSTAQLIQLPVENKYYVEVSSSNQYNTSKLTIINNTTNTRIIDITGSNTILSASIESTYDNTYEVIASTNDLPFLQLTYYDTLSIPVYPTNSISTWNSYLNISASNIDIISNSIYLIGDQLANVETLQISESKLTNISGYGLTSLVSCSISGSGSIGLSQFPQFNESTLLRYLDLQGHETLSSSILISTLNTSDIQTLKLSNCQLSGSIEPSVQLLQIKYYDCSHNALSGSINILPTLPRVEYFICNNNALIGAVPQLTNNAGLQYLDISNNLLTDYTSSSAPVVLTYFDAYQNNLSQSAIENIVKDIYEAGAFNGYLNLSGSGNATASIVTLETASLLEIDREWQVYLNGASVVISASFTDNLGGFPMFSGSYYRFTNTDIGFTYLNLTGTGSNMPYSTVFRASDSNVYEAAISGWLTGSLTNLNYTASLEIIEISASLSSSICTAFGTSAPLSFSFTGSQYSTYRIIGSLEYSGDYYEDYLKYAEAVGI